MYELRFALSAVRLSSAQIVIANGGSSELRMYDPEGHHLRSVGRDGGGPGEFRNMRGLWRYRADSLVVYDPSLRRISVFDTVLSFARSFLLVSPVEELVPSLAGVFPDGSLLVLASAPVTPDLGVGVHRRPAAVLRYGAAGSVEDTIAFVTGEEWVGIDTSNGTALMRRPFGRDSYIATSGSWVVLADGDRFEVVIHATEGDLIRRIQLDARPRRISPEDLASYKQLRIAAASSPEAASRTRETLRALPMHDSYPTIVGMVVDNDENLWLAEPRGPERVVEEYAVIGASGRLLGRVAMPARLQPLEIGSDYVLGRMVDALGVEYIQLHRLMKGE